ncbi:hypothetical protein FRC05_006065 [Tulasnella sp. 425]|nr:hypothetical protein FRC05_006065 [Tulasnella sp. 425]
MAHLIVKIKRKYEKWVEKIKWRHYPQYPNGTLITGRLSEFELTVAARAAARLSSSRRQSNVTPFLPPEIVREIILYATNTFPAPCSIHCPNTSSLSLLPPQPPFPYSGYWFEEDVEIDRKLHALSMRIKLSVSRVSRMWRDVAVEFLFNSIRIHNSKQLSLLWYAFECDASRRGQVAAKGAVAQPGAAPWWIREVWIDLDKFKLVVQPKSEEPLPSFDLADLLGMCPNIVVYRGFGRWEDPQFPLLPKNRTILRQILGLPVEEEVVPEGQEQEVQGSELNIPDTGRRIKLLFVDGIRPFLSLFNRREIPPSGPVATVPSVYSMALHSLITPLIFSRKNNDAPIRLPNLTHLSIRGLDSLQQATRELDMPSLRSLTYRTNRVAFRPPYLKWFLQKHGLPLEELVLLEGPGREQLERLDQLCPILQTFQAHYDSLPLSTLPSVRTVGLYGLERAAANFKSGEIVVFNIFMAFPNVTTIQDMSWRSAVVRRRAFTYWRDPEGAKHRRFWTQMLRTMQVGHRKPVQEVTFLDWKGKVIDGVPTSPPEDPCPVLGPDDELMDALVSGTRI